MGREDLGFIGFAIGVALTLVILRVDSLIDDHADTLERNELITQCTARNALTDGQSCVLIAVPEGQEDD